jgi:uncharacterized protein (TIGR02611 family)
VTTEEPRNRFLRGLEERRERHLERHRLVRIAVSLFGFLLVLAGIAMLVLPGPGLLTIVLGLGILALEFAWAERLLERAVDKMEQAGDTVKEASPAQQAVGLAALLICGAALIAAVVLYDIPVLPG